MTISFSGTSGLTFPDNSTQATAATGFGFKNRIINGAMVIDQRNAGAAVTTANSFPVDRFKIEKNSDDTFSAQQDSSAPVGFVNSTKITITAADASIGSTQYFVIGQYIEGYNVADLNWGSANAKTVTLSFWVRSSLTGTFGGSLRNSAGDRNYAFTYSISTADTWEQKSVIIAGDTSGTWLKTNGTGIQLCFSLGAGSSRVATAGSWGSGVILGASGQTQVISTLNATFYITGVQLEKGSTATSFDYRPYGTELALCQRYYYQLKPGASYPIALGYCRATTRMDTYAFFPVTMRSAPTGSVVSGTNFYYVDYSQSTVNMNSFTIDQTYVQGARLINSGLSGLTAASGASLWTNDATASVGFSSEL
jgi:hypothetical protein